MKLQVIASNVNKGSKQQSLTVHYNQEKEYTCINCDVDIITLGITINVLQDLFNKATAKLDRSLVDEIKTVTRKAAMNSEEYRNKNS